MAVKARQSKLLTKFEVTSSNSFEEMFDRMPIIVGSRDVGHAQFGGNFFCAPARHSPYKVVYQFEVSSSSSFGDMFDRMPKIVGVT